MNIEEAKEKLIRQFGNRVFPFSCAKEQYEKGKTSTGSILIDYMIGGGIPKGYPTTFWGAAGAGKTTAATIAAACALNNDPTRGIIYCDLDVGYSPKYQQETSQRYIDHPLSDRATFNEADNLWMIKTDDVDISMTQEEYEAAAISDDKRIKSKLGDMLHVFVPESGEQLLEFLISACDTEAYQMIIIDPQDLIMPSREIDRKVGAELPGLRAKFLNEFVTRMKLKIWDGNISLIYTSQMRNKFVMMGNPATMSGGFGFQHSMHLTLAFGTPKIQAMKYRGKDRLGQAIPIRAHKSKVSHETLKSAKEGFNPGDYITANLIFGEGWDNEDGVVRLGTHLGVITGQYRWIDSEGQEFKGRGKDNFIETILENNKLDELYKQVLNTKKIDD